MSLLPANKNKLRRFRRKNELHDPPSPILSSIPTHQPSLSESEKTMRFHPPALLAFLAVTSHCPSHAFVQPTPSSLSAAVVGRGSKAAAIVATTTTLSVRRSSFGGGGGGVGITTTTTTTSLFVAAAADDGVGEDLAAPPPAGGGPTQRLPLTRAQKRSFQVRTQLETEIANAEAARNKVLEEIQIAEQKRAQLEQEAQKAFQEAEVKRQRLDAFESRQKRVQASGGRGIGGILGGAGGPAAAGVVTAAVGGLAAARSVLEVRREKVLEAKRLEEEQQQRLAKEKADKAAANGGVAGSGQILLVSFGVLLSVFCSVRCVCVWQGVAWVCGKGF